MNERSRQDEINQAEWRNRDNWRGPPWLGFYASPRDSRAIVPKRPRLFGFTLNFGHPSARWFLAAIAVLAVMVTAVVFFLERA